MGKSRSATILLAYLLWSSRHRGAATTTSSPPNSDSDMISLPSQPLTTVKALELLRQGRPIAEPNEGFMDQLHMYEDMGCPTTEAELKRHKIYRRWMNKRSVDESLRVNMAPEMAAIKFEDESEPEDDDEHTTSSTGTADPSASAPTATSRLGKETRSQGEVQGKHVEPVAPGIKAPDGTSTSSTSRASSSPSEMTLKCRKCRHVLATTPFILAHTPPPHTDPSFHETSPSQLTGSPSPQCAHVFLHPLSWMRPVLAEGKMDGRLACPKCSTNIGKFAWSGLRCSCGGWVTPGFGVARGKVDEVVSRTGGAGSGVRLPPGMRRGGGNL